MRNAKMLPLMGHPCWIPLATSIDLAMDPRTRDATGNQRTTDAAKPARRIATDVAEERSRIPCAHRGRDESRPRGGARQRCTRAAPPAPGCNPNTVKPPRWAWPAMPPLRPGYRPPARGRDASIRKTQGFHMPFSLARRCETMLAMALPGALAHTSLILLEMRKS